MNLTDKVIWITGASSGIGAALAEALTNKKCRLILSGRNVTALKQVQDKCANANVVLLPFDLSDFDQASNIVQKAIAFFGNIDILVVLPSTVWVKVFATNFTNYHNF